MSINRVRKFSTISQLQDFLNGAVRGADISKGVEGIVGRTLHFTSPADHTVTFTASTGTSDPFRGPTFLRFSDIKSQVETATSGGVTVKQEGGTIIFIEATPTSGIVIAADGGDGMANGLLGLDTGNASVGKVYTPPGVTPGAQAWSWIDSTGENAYIVLTWE